MDGLLFQENLMGLVLFSTWVVGLSHRGKARFFRKNSGVTSFFRRNNDGVKTFCRRKNIRKPGPVSQ